MVYLLLACHRDANTRQKQLEGEKVCFGSWFQKVSVHHRREGTAAWLNPWWQECLIRTVPMAVAYKADLPELGTGYNQQRFTQSSPPAHANHHLPKDPQPPKTSPSAGGPSVKTHSCERHFILNHNRDLGRWPYTACCMSLNFLPMSSSWQIFFSPKCNFSNKSTGKVLVDLQLE